MWAPIGFLPFHEAMRRGFGVQYPRRTLRTERLNVNGLMVWVPMLAEAAAPDTAIAVPRLMLSSIFWTSFVSKYPVASLPTNSGLNVNESALRPRLLRYF